MIRLVTLPLGWMILLLVLLPSLASVGIAIAVRRRRPLLLLAENNEFAAITYPVFGLIYGVFLAFSIVIVWQRFTDAEHSTYQEVTALGQVWSDAGAFTPEHREEIHNLLHAYIVAVQTLEWPRMAERRADALTNKAYDNLWQAFYVFEPKTEAEKTFYKRSLDLLNDVGRFRRERLLYSQSEIPGLLWTFLIGGGAVTVAVSYLLGTKDIWMQALMCASITAVIACSLVLILCLSTPFAGDVHISNTVYSDLLQSVGY